MYFANLICLVVFILSFKFHAQAQAQSQAQTHVKAAAQVPALTQAQSMGVEEMKLKNGAKIYFLKETSLPQVSFRGAFRVGKYDEPASLSRINTLVLEMLDQGTKKSHFELLSNTSADMGVNLITEETNEYSFVSMSTLSQFTEKSFAHYWEMVTQSTFPEKEFKRVQSQVLTHLQKSYDNPEAISAILFDEYVYGDAHPFGKSLKVQIDSVGQMKTHQLKEFYRNYYCPQNFILGVTGNFTETQKKKIISTVEKWSVLQSMVTSVDFFLPIPDIGKNSIQLVHKENLQQAQINFAQVSIPRSNPDFLKIRLANMALGGGFSSRLMKEIRTVRGLTYSIYSFLNQSRNLGTYEISTFTKNESVAESVTAILDIFKKFVKEGMTQTELDAAKSQLKGQFPRNLETAEKLISQYIVFDIYGLDKNYFSNFNQLVDNITLDEVNVAVKQYLHPDKMKILIYGDISQIKTQIEKTNIPFSERRLN